MASSTAHDKALTSWSPYPGPDLDYHRKVTWHNGSIWYIWVNISTTLLEDTISRNSKYGTNSWESWIYNSQSAYQETPERSVVYFVLSRNMIAKGLSVVALSECLPHPAGFVNKNPPMTAKCGRLEWVITMAGFSCILYWRSGVSDHHGWLLAVHRIEDLEWVITMAGFSCTSYWRHVLDITYGVHVCITFPCFMYRLPVVYQGTVACLVYVCC